MWIIASLAYSLDVYAPDAEGHEKDMPKTALSEHVKTTLATFSSCDSEF